MKQVVAIKYPPVHSAPLYNFEEAEALGGIFVIVKPTLYHDQDFAIFTDDGAFYVNGKAQPPVLRNLSDIVYSEKLGGIRFKKVDISITITFSN